MRVVFHCFGGTHASPVAAALYLRRMADDRRPSNRDLLALALFDRVEPRAFGHLIPVGADDDGNAVYILGAGRYPRIVLRALHSFAALFGGNPDEWLLVDVQPCVNLMMRLGGLTSRALGWVPLGRAVVSAGTRLAYPKLVKLVQRTRERTTQLSQGASRL